jgi:hypothetical protein
MGKRKRYNTEIYFPCSPERDSQDNSHSIIRHVETTRSGGGLKASAFGHKSCVLAEEPAEDSTQNSLPTSVSHDDGSPDWIDDDIDTAVVSESLGKTGEGSNSRRAHVCLRNNFLHIINY